MANKFQYDGCFHKEYATNLITEMSPWPRKMIILGMLSALERQDEVIEQLETRLITEYADFSKVTEELTAAKDTIQKLEEETKRLKRELKTRNKK